MFEPDTETTGTCMSESDKVPTGMSEPDTEPILVCLSLTQSQVLYV